MPLPTPEKFKQSPEVGTTVVVDTGLAGTRPYLTTITGKGRKDGEPIFFHAGDGWARPEDLTVVPRRMAILMAAVYEGLKEYHPELADETRGAVYLAVLPSYADTGNDQADYEKLRDAVEAEVRRIEAPAPKP